MTKKNVVESEVSESLNEYEPSTTANKAEKTEEDKQLELLEQEYHKLSLIAAILEQRVKIAQLTSMLNPPSKDQEKPQADQQKVKRLPTDY